MYAADTMRLTGGSPAPAKGAAGRGGYQQAADRRQEAAGTSALTMDHGRQRRLRDAEWLRAAVGDRGLRFRGDAAPGGRSHETLRALLRADQKGPPSSYDAPTPFLRYILWVRKGCDC